MNERAKHPTDRQIDDARLAEELLHARHDIEDPFVAAVKGTRMAMVVTDPRQEDNPIIFANDAFCRLTGYEHDELIGHNCRILQGPDTNERETRKLRRAVEQEKDVHVELMNYRKDGTPFWNSLFMSPVRNAKGEVIFFFGSQLDVSEKKRAESNLHSVNDELLETKTLLEQQIDDRTAELMRLLSQRSKLVNELDHRVKNNLQIINSLLGFELRRDLGPEARELLNRLHQRIDALGLAHKDQHNKDAIGYFRVDKFIRVLASKIVSSQPDGVRREPVYDLEKITLPIGKATPLSLALNEFLRALLANPGDGTEGEHELRISAYSRNEMLMIDVAFPQLTRDACNDAVHSVEAWTMRLVENQLDARITFPEEEMAGCGMRITMPLNGTTHA